MNNMNSAILREPIEIHELVTEKTEYGTVKKSYRYKCRTKACVKFNSENKVIQEGEIFFPITREFIVRAYIPIIETDRILYRGNEYSVISINKNIYYNDISIVTTLVNT